METNQIKTDQRLLTLIGSGTYFLERIDPQHLLEDASPVQLILDQLLMRWRLTLVFSNGKELSISGTILENEHIIQAIADPKTDPAQKAVITPAKTIIEALGDLSRIPGYLKEKLAKNGFKNTVPDQTQTEPIPFMKPAYDAVFYKTEDTSPKSSRPLFKKWKFNYILSEQGEATEVEIVAIHKTKTSALAVSTYVDIYGLGNKRMTLTKLLGENRTAQIDCYAKEDGKTIPSLRVAFDLDKRIPAIYFPENKETKGMKKPKAK